MQTISGLFFALALVLAVFLGGQTMDYTWGPALLALAGALGFALPGIPPREGWPRTTWLGFGVVLVACGWILWRCAGSPVREFAREDGLLAAALLTGCLWALLMAPGGIATRLAMLALALLGGVNLGISLYQLKEPAFAWPFASRPAAFPSGLFGHYNHLADFSLVAAVLLAARAHRAGDAAGWRVLFGAGSLAAGACVLLSGSRGGALGLASALAVYLGVWTVIAWRDKTPQRKILAVLSLIFPLALAMAAGTLLHQVEQRRGMVQSSGSVEGTADNVFRLTFVGIAFDVAAGHAWRGGGSRSFGWEKYAEWDPHLHGNWDRFDDDLVHNELAQVATDYGWTGALLVASAILTVGLAGVAGLLSRGGGGKSGTVGDAAVLGALAAMAGTLVHSNFSFVTHTLPGALYLGLALGWALPRGGAGMAAGRGTARSAWIGRALVLPLAGTLGFAGWQAGLCYRELWPVWFVPKGLGATLPDESLARIDRARQRWPGAELAGQAAGIARRAAEQPVLPAGEREEWLAQAAGYYAEAARLNPFDPEWAINGANLLSTLGRDDEAERFFVRAIELQGGMESLFRARYYYGRHLYQRWYRLWTRERREEEALHQFLLAREVLTEAKRVTPDGYWGAEGLELAAGLEQVIRFLEEAKVRPRAPER